MIFSIFAENAVTPFVGVWIETCRNTDEERHKHVTPFVGVWIETHTEGACRRNGKVTPFVGVWIETDMQKTFAPRALSHPSWVCGLKPKRHAANR